MRPISPSLTRHCPLSAANVRARVASSQVNGAHRRCNSRAPARRRCTIAWHISPMFVCARSSRSCSSTDIPFIISLWHDTLFVFFGFLFWAVRR
jgi:hypothetical protein